MSPLTKQTNKQTNKTARLYSHFEGTVFKLKAHHFVARCGNIKKDTTAESTEGRGGVHCSVLECHFLILKVTHCMLR